MHNMFVVNLTTNPNTIMKLARMLTLSIFLIGSVAPADVVSPVIDYQKLHKLQVDDIFYRIDLDINGDGKNAVLLTSEDDLEEVKLTKVDKTEEVPSWYFYIAKRDGSGYVLSSGVDSGGAIGAGLPKINPKQLYVGMIKQLGKRGIVTIQVDHLRKGGGNWAYIFAYTIEGDHLKETQLAKYELEKGNPIYEQYLTESKRTKVKLQVVKMKTS